ncbi:MAG: hypothetical protein QXX09_04920, partial [Candidatus Methanomethylicia archaeon]
MWKNFWLKCVDCGLRFSGDVFRCPNCGGALILEYDFDYLASGFNTFKSSTIFGGFWRYRSLFPHIPH